MMDRWLEQPELHGTYLHGVPEREAGLERVGGDRVQVRAGDGPHLSSCLDFDGSCLGFLLLTLARRTRGCWRTRGIRVERVSICPLAPVIRRRGGTDLATGFPSGSRSVCRCGGHNPGSHEFIEILGAAAAELCQLAFESRIFLLTAAATSRRSAHDKHKRGTALAGGASSKRARKTHPSAGAAGGAAFDSFPFSAGRDKADVSQHSLVVHSIPLNMLLPPTANSAAATFRD